MLVVHRHDDQMEPPPTKNELIDFRKAQFLVEGPFGRQVPHLFSRLESVPPSP